MTIKLWHFILALIVAFALGAMYPGPFNMVKAKLTGGSAAA